MVRKEKNKKQNKKLNSLFLGSIHQVSIPLQKDQLVKRCIKTCHNGVPSLFFSRSVTSKSQVKNSLKSTKDRLQNLLKGRTILCTIQNCKLKGSTGTIYITVEYLLHKSRNDKKATSIYRCDEIEDVCLLKDKELIFYTKTNTKNSVSISSKSMSELCQIFRFLVILTKPCGLSQLISSNIEIRRFILEFPSRHLPKPTNLHAAIVKEFRDKICRTLTEHPLWNCGTFKEIASLRSNVLNFLLDKLFLL